MGQCDVSGWAPIRTGGEADAELTPTQKAPEETSATEPPTEERAPSETVPEETGLSDQGEASDE